MEIYFIFQLFFKNKIYKVFYEIPNECNYVKLLSLSDFEDDLMDEQEVDEIKNGIYTIYSKNIRNKLKQKNICRFNITIKIDYNLQGINLFFINKEHFLESIKILKKEFKLKYFTTILIE